MYYLWNYFHSVPDGILSMNKFEPDSSSVFLDPSGDQGLVDEFRMKISFIPKFMAILSGFLETNIQSN